MNEKILFILFAIAFLGGMGYYLIYTEPFTSNNLPTGYYTDKSICQSKCINTPCSDTYKNGYCSSGQCINIGTDASPNYSCRNVCSATNPCASGELCNGTYCEKSCSSTYLSGKCSSDGKTVDPNKACIVGECKQKCSADNSPGASIGIGVCVDAGGFTIDTGKTCDIDGQCRSACSATNTSGYCPTGQSCINGTCTPTYSCSNSCAATRVIG
jgi:hypothetical protein